MKLSNQYRVILASFNLEPTFSRVLSESFHEGSGHYDAAFWVGNFEYEVIFKKHYTKDDFWEDVSPEDSNDYTVLFKLSDFRFSSDEEMVQVVSKIAKRPLTVDQALRFMQTFDKYGLTNLGDSRPILSGVIFTIKQFIGMAKPSCLIFDAYEPKRRRLYEAILNHLKGKMGFESTSEVGSSAQQFTLCLNSPGQPQ